MKIGKMLVSGFLGLSFLIPTLYAQSKPSAAPRRTVPSSKYMEKLPNGKTRVKNYEIFTDPSFKGVYIFFQGNPDPYLKEDLRRVYRLPKNQTLKLGKYTVVSRGPNGTPQDLIRAKKIIVTKGTANFREITPSSAPSNAPRIFTTYSPMVRGQI